MNSLNSGYLAQVLDRLHQRAEAADLDYRTEVMAELEAAGTTLEQVIAEKLAEERADYRKIYRDRADNFLAVSPAYGRFLYAIARACKATR
ncbi:MAG: methyltransferase, partial [Rhizobiales bacterium 32-66-8]